MDSHAERAMTPFFVQDIAFPDDGEAERRDYILRNTGKGRLASQDAVLPRSGVPTGGSSEIRYTPERSVSIVEFFASEQATSSNSPAFARRGSDPGLLEGSTVRRRFSNLKFGGIFGKVTPGNSRRGSFVDGVGSEDVISVAKTPTSLFSPDYSVGLKFSSDEDNTGDEGGGATLLPICSRGSAY